MARRFLPAIVLLSVILHGIGIARSSLPAQDGLKFLRVARQFHTMPWVDVVRGTDQHPLYPACIAAAHPFVSLWTGSEPDSWRITAQIVSALAAIATIFPLFALARALFDEGVATLCALLFVLLPLPSAVGHDTLSDPLALFLIVSALALGETALRRNCIKSAIGCGIVSGLGYLARPEVAIVPLAVLITGISRMRLPDRVMSRALACQALSFLAVVGSYAVVKGELSEKLALRRAVGISSTHDAKPGAERALPPGLNASEWDFAAKEESDHPSHLTRVEACVRLASRWGEAMGYALVPFAIWGLWRRSRSLGTLLLVIYAFVFSVILIRHAMKFGYLSSRHTLSLVLVSLPFASFAMMRMAACVRARLMSAGADSPRSRVVRRGAAITAILVIAVGAQLHHAPHVSRWGHGEAGRWLASHSAGNEKVLDTRGWATFVSERPAHDYWHVRQAIVDPALAYVVVDEDERTASSRRGETLRAILAYAAEPIAEFPDRRGADTIGVRIYRFHPPTDWKGMRP